MALRTPPSMKNFQFRITRNPNKAPLKFFPKPCKTNQPSPLFYPLTPSLQTTCLKAKHNPHVLDENSPQEGIFHSQRLHKVAEFIHNHLFGGATGERKLERVPSVNKVLLRLQSEHEEDEDAESTFMEALGEHIEMDDLQRKISWMKPSQRKDEAINKLKEKAEQNHDLAYELELLIVELLIYKEDYTEASNLANKLKAKNVDSRPDAFLAVIHTMTLGKEST